MAILILVLLALSIDSLHKVFGQLPFLLHSHSCSILEQILLKLRTPFFTLGTYLLFTLGLLSSLLCFSTDLFDYINSQSFPFLNSFYDYRHAIIQNLIVP